MDISRLSLYVQSSGSKGSSHFSPPGLSKRQQPPPAPRVGQPLLLNQQSEIVCRRQQLESMSSALGGLVGVACQDSLSTSRIWRGMRQRW